MEESRKATLKRKIQEAREELDRIESAEWHAANRDLIGSCWRLRTCASCPESEADYWLVYAMVLRIDLETRRLDVLRFERTAQKEVRVAIEETGLDVRRYERIGADELVRAWDLLKAEIGECERTIAARIEV